MMQKLLIPNLILLLLTLQACASHIPSFIQKPPTEDLSLTRVQSHPDKHINKIVRWGGTIIQTANEKQQTTLTILAKPLDSYGEPLKGDQSYGRFIARVNGFLDPAIYAKGRAITLYGKFTKLLNKKIDNFNYQYPVINVEHSYLWEDTGKQDYYDNPYWYDPWYPYWGPYHQRHRHY